MSSHRGRDCVGLLGYLSLSGKANLRHFIRKEQEPYKQLHVITESGRDFTSTFVSLSPRGYTCDQEHTILNL